VRTRRVVVRMTALAMWLLAIAPVTATFAAGDGSTLDAYGWWNKQQALPVQGDPTGLGLATVPTVPAPTAPADGMQVASDPSGPSAIAAVRYLVGGGGTLTLRVPDGTTLTGTEHIVACPVQGGFTPAQNGQWTSKPAYDPTTCIVEGKVSDDASSFTFDIPATFVSSLGDVSVVLVPAADATPFTVSFDKPTDDAYTVTTQVESPQVEPSTPPAYEPGTAVYVPPAASASPSLALPTTPAVATPSSSTQSQAAPSVPVGSTTPVSTDRSRTPQLMAVALLALIGAALWRLGGQPQRAPRLLGSVGGAASVAAPAPVIQTTRARGVGRFARHRDAPPTAI
jgi:hypothetical protein